MGLDKRRLNQLDRLMIDWGQWISTNKAVIGMYSTSVWPSGRPSEPRRRRFTRKTLLPHTQPKETRSTLQRTPAIIRFDRDLEAIHPVILKLDEDIKHIIVCLYIRGMCFSDITKAFNIPSRAIGDRKYKALKAISNVVK